MDRPLHGLRSLQAGTIAKTCAVDARLGSGSGHFWSDNGKKL